MKLGLAIYLYTIASISCVFMIKQNSETPIHQILQDLSNLITDIIISTVDECALVIISDQHFKYAIDQATTKQDLAYRPKVLVLLEETNDNRTMISDELAFGLHVMKLEKCIHYIILMEQYKKMDEAIRRISTPETIANSKVILVSSSHTNGMSFATDDLMYTVFSTIRSTVYITIPSIQNLSSKQHKDWLHISINKFYGPKFRFEVAWVANWHKEILFSAKSSERTRLPYFQKRIADFHKTKFRVTTFHYPPSVIFGNLGTDLELMDGLEIQLLKTLSSSLNFRLNIQKPNDRDKWGKELSNGSYTGAFGEILRGETDISVANYFITSERLKLCDMTKQHQFDYTCFITPLPKPLPRYGVIVWPFQIKVWMTILLCLVVLPLSMKMLSGDVRKTRALGSFESFFLVWTQFLNQPHNHSKLPQTTSLRILWASIAFAGLVIGVIYGTSLFSMLLLPSPAKPVNSLKDLLESPLQWGVKGNGGWEKWFRHSKDRTAQDVAKGFQFVPDIKSGIDRVVEGNFAFMNSGNFLRYLIATNFSNEIGQPQLHIAKQCFIPFRIGMVLQKNSVYRSEFNEKIQMIVEAGLVNHWFEDLLTRASRKFQKPQTADGITIDGSSSITLGLDNLQGPFIILLIGLLVACGIFLTEVAIC